MWTVRADLWMNGLPHPGSGHTCGRSPECIRSESHVSNTNDQSKGDRYHGEQDHSSSQTLCCMSGMETTESRLLAMSLGPQMKVPSPTFACGTFHRMGLDLHMGKWWVDQVL